MLQNRLCKKYDVFLRKREMSSILNLYNALGLCETFNTGEVTATGFHSYEPAPLTSDTTDRVKTIGLSIKGSNGPVTDLYVC